MKKIALQNASKDYKTTNAKPLNKKLSPFSLLRLFCVYYVCSITKVCSLVLETTCGIA